MDGSFGAASLHDFTDTHGIAVSVWLAAWLTNAPRGARAFSGVSDLDLATVSE